MSVAAKRGPAPSYDLDALHRILWLMSEPRRHRLSVDRAALAERLMVNPTRLSRHLSQLAADGRIRRLGRVGNRYQVVVTQPPVATDVAGVVDLKREPSPERN